MSGDLDNIVLGVIERWWASRYSERHGLVTSYDPKKYLAKVTFMPEGQESGWLPIETGHIGDGFGIAIGLTPGDGKATGDQVIVRFQEGDFEAGKIVKRVHSDKEKPPKVESGEMVFWHKNGAKIFFSKDGSLLLQGGTQDSTSSSGDPNSSQKQTVASYKLDGKGNITMTGNKKDDTLEKTHTETIKGDKNVTIKGKRSDNVSKVWNAVAQFGIWSWLTVKDDVSD
jgi:phage baseplate assembly protein gpV